MLAYRSIVRSIAGDHEAALEDFQKLRNDNSQFFESVDQWARQFKISDWMGELRAGRNPFDSETLEKLREKNKPRLHDFPVQNTRLWP